MALSYIPVVLNRKAEVFYHLSINLSLHIYQSCQFSWNFETIIYGWGGTEEKGLGIDKILSEQN
jgi:hypothetical protein